MLHSWTLRDLLDSGVAVRSSEAVAIVQRLMHEDTGATDAAGPCGPLALHNVEIDSNGDVRCMATAATPSVYETAVLLQELLSAGTTPVPGALRYTVSRALLEVDAPPFDSRQQFGAALARFEDGDRADAIAALHARASTRGPRSDRRRATTAHAGLRRELRDSDLRLYAAMAALRPAVAPGHSRVNAGPIAGCMLAGAALIAAGGATSAVRHASVAEPVPPVVERRTYAADIALPAQQPALEPDVTVRTQPRPAARPARRNVRSAAAGRTRREPRIEPARQRRPADADRGVIARIRFEWNNPFR